MSYVIYLSTATTATCTNSTPTTSRPTYDTRDSNCNNNPFNNGKSKKRSEPTSSNQGQPESERTKAKVINISKRSLTLGQISLLTKGPKFCPTKNGNYLEIKSDTKAFTRKLKLMEAFHDLEYHEESIVKEKSSFEPKIKNKHLTFCCDTFGH